MTLTQLYQYIEQPELLNRDTLYELRTLMSRYPYFQTLRLLYLKNLYLLNDADYTAELRKSAIYVANRSRLFYLIEQSNYELPQKTVSAPTMDEQEEEGNRTLQLIDSFLSANPEEQSQELDYAVDYTTYLLQDKPETEEESEATAEEVPQMRGHDLIDDFLSEQKQTTTEEEEEEKPTAHVAEEYDEDSCFTETLAKIYVKQQRYDKALEIIKKLSLNYPKKNAYFADQIRFLEKLIINAKSK